MYKPKHMKPNELVSAWDKITNFFADLVDKADLLADRIEEWCEKVIDKMFEFIRGLK